MRTVSNYMLPSVAVDMASLSDVLFIVYIKRRERESEREREEFSIFIKIKKQHTRTQSWQTFTIKENAKQTKTLPFEVHVCLPVYLYSLMQLYIYIKKQHKTEQIKTWRDQPSALFEFVSVFHFQVSFTIVEVPLVLQDLQEIFQWTKPHLAVMSVKQRKSEMQHLIDECWTKQSVLFSLVMWSWLVKVKRFIVFAAILCRRTRRPTKTTTHTHTHTTTTTNRNEKKTKIFRVFIFITVLDTFFLKGTHHWCGFTHHSLHWGKHWGTGSSVMQCAALGARTLHWGCTEHHPAQHISFTSVTP